MGRDTWLLVVALVVLGVWLGLMLGI